MELNDIEVLFYVDRMHRTCFVMWNFGLRIYGVFLEPRSQILWVVSSWNIVSCKCLIFFFCSYKRFLVSAEVHLSWIVLVPEKSKACHIRQCFLTSEGAIIYRSCKSCYINQAVSLVETPINSKRDYNLNIRTLMPSLKHRERRIKHGFVWQNDQANVRVSSNGHFNDFLVILTIWFLQWILFALKIFDMKCLP